MCNLGSTATWRAVKEKTRRSYTTWCIDLQLEEIWIECVTRYWADEPGKEFYWPRTPLGTGRIHWDSIQTQWFSCPKWSQWVFNRQHHASRISSTSLRNYGTVMWEDSHMYRHWGYLEVKHLITSLSQSKVTTVGLFTISSAKQDVKRWMNLQMG